MIQILLNSCRHLNKLSNELAPSQICINEQWRSILKVDVSNGFGSFTASILGRLYLKWQEVERWFRSIWFWSVSTSLSPGNGDGSRKNSFPRDVKKSDRSRRKSVPLFSSQNHTNFANSILMRIEVKLEEGVKANKFCRLEFFWTTKKKQYVGRFCDSNM